VSEPPTEAVTVSETPERIRTWIRKNKKSRKSGIDNDFSLRVSFENYHF